MDEHGEDTTRMDGQHAYMLTMRTRLSAFSLCFDAASSEAAAQFARTWIEDAHLGAGSEVTLREPDGTIVVLREADAPDADSTTGGAGDTPATTPLPH
jgi:hypothetical protein